MSFFWEYFYRFSWFCKDVSQLQWQTYDTMIKNSLRRRRFHYLQGGRRHESRRFASFLVQDKIMSLSRRFAVVFLYKNNSLEIVEGKKIKQNHVIKEECEEIIETYFFSLTQDKVDETIF